MSLCAAIIGKRHWGAKIEFGAQSCHKGPLSKARGREWSPICVPEETVFETA